MCLWELLTLSVFDLGSQKVFPLPFSTPLTPIVTMMMMMMMMVVMVVVVVVVVMEMEMETSGIHRVLTTCGTSSASCGLSGLTHTTTLQGGHFY